MTEEDRAISDEMANMLNTGLFSRIGLPLPWSTPPGTAAEVANATVAMNAARTEHDSEVLVSHSLPSCTRSRCASVKTSSGVLPLEITFRGRLDKLHALAEKLE